MPISLTLEEQETHLNMTAANRKMWEIYSDDAVMQRKLEKIGATLVKTERDGLGRHYTLPANQVSFRNPSKPMSEEQKRASAKGLAEWRKSQATADETDGDESE